MEQLDLVIYRFGHDLRIRRTPFGWLMISLKEDGTKFKQYVNVSAEEALTDFCYRLIHDMLDGGLVGKEQK